MKRDHTESATQIVLAAIAKGLPGTGTLDEICNFYRAIYDCMTECSDFDNRTSNQH